MDDLTTQPRVDGEELIPPGLVKQVCLILGMPGDAIPEDFEPKLRKIATDYLLDRSAQRVWGKPKEQRLAIRKLLGSVRRTLSDLSMIAPEYAIALHEMHDRTDARGPIVTEQASTALVALGRAIIKFDKHYEPRTGPRPDVVLEEAVRNLMAAIAQETGEQVCAQLNKHKGCKPTLESRGARAVGILLRGVDPKLRVTKIANMIEKVRRQPDPSESHFDPLFRLTVEQLLDASLLPNRQGNQQV